MTFFLTNLFFSQIFTVRSVAEKKKFDFEADYPFFESNRTIEWSNICFARKLQRTGTIERWSWKFRVLSSLLDHEVH